MSELGALLVLVAAIWGSFGVCMKAYESINNRRDIILCGRKGRTKYSLDHRRLMFFSDMIPMQAGIVIFMGVLVCLLWHVPSFVAAGSEIGHITIVSRIAAVVPLSLLVGYLVGGFKDIRATGKALEAVKRNELEEENRKLNELLGLYTQENAHLKRQVNSLSYKGQPPGHEAFEAAKSEIAGEDSETDNGHSDGGINS